MIPELRATLTPLHDAVTAAEEALAASNADDHTHPLETLALAGALIRHQENLIDRLWGLCDAIGEPVTDEDRLRIHGRIRAAEELNARD